MIHPAVYSDVLLPIFQRYAGDLSPVLDPFAGTGKLRKATIQSTIITNELEPEWARLAGRPGIVGNALALAFASETFGAVVTSPVYGNRMSDHHNARDASRRITYTHVLGHKLHPENSGQLQWGDAYRAFHLAAWREVYRVLRADGRFVLNVSDHIRKGQVQHVTAWHVEACQEIGFVVSDKIEIQTPRMRRGENHALRVDCESVIVFVKE